MHQGFLGDKIMLFSIAIDGPAGAGKSTIAKFLAKKLSFVYIDTGAMYRAIGFYAYNHVFKSKPFVIDSVTTQEIYSFLSVSLNSLVLKINYINEEQHIYMNNEDITDMIRSQEMGTMASVVSTIKEVRVFLVKEQQRMAKEISVVMDGRDIGTHVLPQAPVKIYLTASSEIRAKRRYDQLVQKGETPDFQLLKAEIEERDYRDMNREHAPLRRAEDAIELDTSEMNIQEVVDCIYEIVTNRMEQ